MRKVIFFAAWILILSIPVFTLLSVTPLSITLSTPARLTNFVQRALGLFAFSLLFVQIILGEFMDGISEKIGGWVFNFHIFEGIITYIIVFLHPIFFLLFNHYVGGSLDPYAAFVNVCLLCKTPLDYYYTIGRISFWLLTLVVFIAIFRKTNPWLKANWRKFHILSYLIFLGVSAHGFLIGTDFKIEPFYGFAIISTLIVLGLTVFIEIPRYYKDFKNWVRS